MSSGVGPNSLQHFVGCRLKRDLYSKSGTLLMRASTIFREEHIHHRILQKMGLTVSDFTNEAESSAQIVIEDAMAHARFIFEKLRLTNRISIIDLNRKIVPAVRKLSANAELVSLYHKLQKKEDYTYYHSIGVAIIAAMIGRWMKMKEQELTELTIAALLHDIGKIRIPGTILNKPDRLTDEEFTIMKRHTIYGYEILKEMEGITFQQSLAALQHHEREDGSGYPLGLVGNKINIVSKIVAVADVFHAITSTRVYHEAIPYFQALQSLQMNAFGKLDPAITTLLVDKLMSSSIGRNIILTDGRRGRIVMINPHNRMKPLVEVNSNFIDLSRERDVNLFQVIG